MASAVDRFGIPGWIGVTALSFLIWWPVGVATLGYLYWRRHMGCGHHGRMGWHERRERWREAKEQWRQARMAEGGYAQRRDSGNTAFDDYRGEALKKLEAEEQEFRGFLDRLRRAKDKAEFDQFMTERSATPPAGQTI